MSVTITEVGARGDGLAEADGQRLYIPLVLPGEAVTVRPGAPRGDGREAALLTVEQPSPERVPPPCPAFGTCGGCALQHWRPDGEARWKAALVATALARHGLDPAVVAPVESIGPHSRRRVTLNYARPGSAAALILGFHARQSHALVPLPATGCALLAPALATTLPGLAAALAPAVPPGGRGALHLSLCDEGVDARLDLPGPPDLAAREALAAAAAACDLARLTLRVKGLDEPLAARRPPHVSFAGTPVALPAGGFLQASQSGEQTLARLVLSALAEVGVAPGAAVLDLFCGLGTFALPLARAGYAVTAADADRAAVAALQQAAGGSGLRAIARDLFDQPWQGAELAPFAAVVLDPPRAGARAQAEALVHIGAGPAAVVPAAVVMVSCNPATFARDARILADGGYRLRAVWPVDQFAWSPHVELVAVCERTG